MRDVSPRKRQRGFHCDQVCCGLYWNLTRLNESFAGPDRNTQIDCDVIETKSLSQSNSCLYVVPTLIYLREVDLLITMIGTKYLGTNLFLPDLP